MTADRSSYVSFRLPLNGPGKQGAVLTAIVAFAWIAFGVLSVIKALVGMHYAYLAGAAASGVATAAPVKEKPTPAPVNV